VVECYCIGMANEAQTLNAKLETLFTERDRLATLERALVDALGAATPAVDDQIRWNLEEIADTQRALGAAQRSSK